MVNRTHGGDGIETYNLYVGDVFSLRARKREETRFLARRLNLSQCIVYHFSPLNRNSGIPCFSATSFLTSGYHQDAEYRLEAVKRFFYK